MTIERLIDSVIVIDHLNGVSQATRFLLELNPAQTAISVITRAEILSGLDDEVRPEVRAFLDEYHLFIIDRSIADLAAELRRKFRWKLPDAFQAALAEHHHVRLTTRNTKDFSPNKHKFVEVPYQIRS